MADAPTPIVGEESKEIPQKKEIRLTLRKVGGNVQDAINTVVEFHDSVEKAKELGWELVTLSIEDSW